MSSPTITVDPALVLRLARLASLELSNAEVDDFAHRLQEILTYAASLDKFGSVISESGRRESLVDLRVDQPLPSSLSEALLDLAPDRSGEMFRVPRVLD